MAGAGKLLPTVRAMSKRLPTLYIPHGGGPCFFMEPQPGLPRDLWDAMASYLRSLGADVGMRPQSVLVISGHWEMPRPTVSTAQRPPLLFDYYGFPEHTYRLTYPAAGSPKLASDVSALLAAAGIESGADPVRGLDHGVFVPFKLIYPDADLPMVQLSLDSNLDAGMHFRIGAALAPLREEGVLIVGSGMSYHNLRHIFSLDPGAIRAAVEFDTWLGEAATEPDPVVRERKLAAWSSAPGALSAHPRPEHLIPLMVAAGAAATDAGRRTYNEPLLGKPISGFQFGSS
jgi:aromatic ring-opening dioxygenase catalytic subunit (LigB family)